MWDRWGMFFAFLYSLAVPVETLQLLGGRSVAVVPAAGLTLAWLMLLAERRGSVRVPTITWLLTAFLAWCTLSAWWSTDAELTFTWVRTMALTLVSVVALASLLTTARRRDWCIAGYVIGATIVAISTTRAEMRGQFVASYDARVTTLSQDPNALSIIMALGLAGALHLTTLSALRGLTRMLLWCCVPLLAFGILFTGSRTGLLAVLGVAVIHTLRLMRGRTHPGRLIVLAGAALGVLYYAPKWLPADVSARLLGTQAAVSTGNFNYRQVIWGHAVHFIVDRPLQGYGAGAFLPTYDKLVGAPFASHNVFIGTAVETGLIGLALLVACLWVPFRSACRTGPRALWLSLAVAWLCGAMTLTLTAEKVTWWLVAVMASCATVTVTERQVRQPAPRSAALECLG